MVTIQFNDNGKVSEGQLDTHTLQHLKAHSYVEVLVDGNFKMVAVANILNH